MKCTIKINMDNAAFGDNPTAELQRILNKLVNRLGDIGLPTDEINLKDVNGNTVGTCKID